MCFLSLVLPIVMYSGKLNDNLNNSLDTPSVTFDHETLPGPKTQDRFLTKPLKNLQASSRDQPDKLQFAESENNRYETSNSHLQNNVLAHGNTGLNPLVKNKYGNSYQAGSTEFLNTDPGHPYDERPLINIGDPNKMAPARDEKANDSLNTSLTDFGGLKANYSRFTQSQKRVTCLIFLLSMIAWVVTLVLVMVLVVAPRIKKANKVTFFCLYQNNMSDHQSELCVFSVAQQSFGIIAIGQIAVGVIAIGQVSFGFITIAQVGFAVLFTIFAQATLSLFVLFCQLGVSVFYTRICMAAVSPMSALRNRKRPSPFKLDYSKGLK